MCACMCAGVESLFVGEPIIKGFKTNEVFFLYEYLNNNLSREELVYQVRTLSRFDLAKSRLPG